MSKLRAPGNYDTDAASLLHAVFCPLDEAVTQQQFKEEADINVIVARFGLTGEIPGDFQAPVSGDFSNVGDFQSAMNAVRTAQESFMRLPADLRLRFNHDPQVLMRFLDDPGNRDEAIKLGLVNKPAEVTRDAVRAIDELAAKLVVDKK